MKSKLLLVAMVIGFCISAHADVPQTVKKVTPSVVLIKGTTASGEALGSGFLLSNDGKIATNLHVIRDLRSGAVQLSSGEVFDGFSVLAFDERKDLAVIKIAGFDLIPADLGNSNNIAVGESVIALGSPRGLNGTITTGVVSALRDHPDGFKMVQTDAAVNPGNSGGPLVNAKGEVIGVVVGKWKDSEGLNFALPINYVRGMLSALGEPMTLDALRQKLGATTDVFSQTRTPAMAARWKSLTAGGVHSVRVDGEHLYAERVNIDPNSGLNFQLYDLAKTGDGYKGRIRMGARCQYKDTWSPDFKVNTCVLENNIEMSVVSPSRIEGRAVFPPKGAEFNCKKCTYSKPNSEWHTFVWIPE